MTYHMSRNPPLQNGSILIQFALLVLVLIAILGTIQIGYMYYAKRDLQRIADMAALESANAIKIATTCNDAKNSGKQSIDAQWPLGITTTGNTLDKIECGQWTKAAGFVSVSPFNAARVTLSGESLQLVPFTGNRTVGATATAAIASDSIASFSIGSGVARLNAGALNSLLTLLLGTSVNLSLADYTGLANTNVNLLGLMNALQVNAGNYAELLNTTVSLEQLLQASIQVAENIQDQATADIAINALGNLLALPATLNLNNTFINLLKDGSQKGLVDLGIYQNLPSSALNADVSALSVLTTALQIANANSAAALQTTLDLGVLAKTTVAVKIIEPPVIATGPAGKDGSGQYITRAHTGQVRTKIDLQALNALTSSGNLLDLNLLFLLRLQASLPSSSAINLPIYVEVASADGELESISCHFYAANTHKTTILAKPGVAHIFLGKIPDAMTNTTTAWGGLSKDYFNLLDINVRVTLLGLTIVSAPVKLMAKLDLSIDNPKSALDFSYSTEKPRSEQNLIKTVGSETKLGAALGNALSNNLLQFRLDTSGLTLLGIDLDYLSVIVDALVNSLSIIVGVVVSLLSTLLNPIFILLDSLLGPLLKTLGLQIGYADVELLWTDCNPAQLVN